MQPQDLDLICSPHLEERLIGGNVDLDHLFQIPQKDARIMGGRGGEASSSKDSNGGERVRRDKNQGGRRPPLNSSPRI